MDRPRLRPRLKFENPGQPGRSDRAESRAKHTAEATVCPDSEVIESDDDQLAVARYRLGRYGYDDDEPENFNALQTCD